MRALSRAEALIVTAECMRRAEALPLESEERQELLMAASLALRMLDRRSRWTAWWRWMRGQSRG